MVWALGDGARPILAVTKPAVRGQWAREVERFTNVPAIVLESTEPTLPPLPPPPYFLVTGYATLPYWVEELERLRPRSLILDECFPAGTPVMTIEGPRSIEAIADGT